MTDPLVLTHPFTAAQLDAAGYTREGAPSLYADAAERAIEKLAIEHPEVVEAVIASTLIASPLAGPQRILAEIRSVLREEER